MIIWSIITRQALFTINSCRELRAVDANPAARHLPSDVNAEISFVNVGTVAAFVGVAVTLTFFASILLLWRSDPKWFLVVQWTASLAALPACVVHAFALRQLTRLLIILIDFFAAFSSMAHAMTAALNENRLKRVVAALLQVVLVRFPLQRTILFDLADILKHALKANADEPCECKIDQIRCENLDRPVIQNDKLGFTLLQPRRIREFRAANHFFVVLEDVVCVATC